MLVGRTPFFYTCNCNKLRKPGWNMQTRLLSAVTMVTHERGTALSPPDSSLREGGKCHTKYKEGWKTVAGEVLIGPEMLFSFDNIFFGEGCFNGNALLSVVVVPPPRWRPLQQDIYMEGSHRVPRDMNRCALFSASLLFLKCKWFCCAAYSLANGAHLQPLSRHWGWNISSVLERRKVLKFEKTRLASLSFSASMAPCIDSNCFTKL